MWNNSQKSSGICKIVKLHWAYAAFQYAWLLPNLKLLFSLSTVWVNWLTPLLYKSITIILPLLWECWGRRGNNTSIFKYQPKYSRYLWNVRLAPVLSHQPSKREINAGEIYSFSKSFSTHTPPLYGRFTFLWALN